jgi:Tol biopolymer transport system component
VPDDTNGAGDVFVHDRKTGTTTRIASLGRPFGNIPPAISADGRFVAFSSDETTLVPDDNNGFQDVFVHDRQTRRTERVSIGPAGTEANEFSEGSTISANGRFIAFVSGADNLVAGDTNGIQDIFVYDRKTGTNTLVSVGPGGAQANGASYSTAISADGRFVAFPSEASNLVPNDTNNLQDIFVHDRKAEKTTLVSVRSDGTQADGFSLDPAVSADGRFVAFASDARNLMPGGRRGPLNIFVHDRNSGKTTRVSVGRNGTPANRECRNPAISANGRYIAFPSRARNLVPGDTNGSIDVFVHDRKTGVTSRVSVGRNGAQGNGDSAEPTLSANGRLVVFSSLGTNLVPGDTNNAPDIFVRAR